MPTTNQSIRGARKPKRIKKKTLDSPQQGGVCTKIMKINPKKPNSALRSCAKIILNKTKKKITVYIPGEGHNLQEFSNVFIQGGGAQDLLGVARSVIRGGAPRRGDTEGVKGRKQGRSKYGTKKNQ